jgi:tetratricopeptide (TPR) repeat protein
VAYSLNNLGLVLMELGDLDGAGPLFEESLAIKRELADRRGQAMTLINLGLLASRQRRHGAAVAALGESLTLLAELDDRAAGAEALSQLAGNLTALGRAEGGVRLLGAQEALRETLGFPVAPADLADYEAVVAATREALGGPAYEAGWAAGRALAWEEAVAEALRAAAALVSTASSPSPAAGLGRG